MSGTTCLICGEPMPAQPGAGRKRAYCCRWCKDVASFLSRLEEGGYAEIVARAMAAGRPQAVSALRARLFHLVNGENRRDPVTGRFVSAAAAE